MKTVKKEIFANWRPEHGFGEPAADKFVRLPHVDTCLVINTR